MRIRRLVEEIDEQHREAMRSIEEDLARRRPETDEGVGASRRRFVRNLGIGSAVAVGAAAVPTVALATAASAQSSSSGSTSVVLPSADLTIVNYAVGLELAYESAYTTAMSTKQFDSEQSEMARAFASHHHEHAVTLATLAGRTSDTVGFPNGALDSALTSQVQGAGSADAILQVLYGMEQNAAATYLQAIGDLESRDASGPAGSILPIEAQHATAIGSALQLPIDQWLPPFQTTQGAYSPSRYAG